MQTFLMFYVVQCFLPVDEEMDAACTFLPAVAVKRIWIHHFTHSIHSLLNLDWIGVKEPDVCDVFDMFTCVNHNNV